MSAFRASAQHLGVTSHQSFPTVPIDILDRWVAGVPTADDHAWLAAYIADHPSARDFLAALGGPERVTPDLDAMRRSIAQAIEANAAEVGVVSDGTAPAAHRRSISARVRGIGGYLAGALAVATVLVVSLLVVRHGTVSHKPARHYATQSGQRATVELADGSRITLAPRSTLTLIEDTHGHPVTADLVGEAHFDIVPNRAAPFAVQAGPVVTRVLGTTFDVRRYADERVGQVVVLSGKVSVQGVGAARTVAANMMASFTDSSVATSVVNDPAQYTDWTHGSLVFRDTPVPVVLATLKRWYGYEFRLSDSTLASDVVTTVFPLGETQEMMQRLRRLLGVSMTFEDSVITLQPSQGVSAPRPVRQDKSTSPLTTLREVGR